MRNRLTDTELKTLLKNIVIIQDSREQQTDHITSYFDKKKIKYITGKVNSGDYSCYIESNEDTKGIIGNRNLWFDNILCIERKNSISELAQSIKDRDRFENEFDRALANKVKLLLFVEDSNGLKTILNHKYTSQYAPKALYASLKKFETKYNFTTNYVSKELIGMEIYYTLYYAIRNYLK